MGLCCFPGKTEFNLLHTIPTGEMAEKGRNWAKVGIGIHSLSPYKKDFVECIS